MLLALVLLSLQQTHAMDAWPNSAPVPAYPGEKHLRNIRQLTFGGQNAEAYWSPDGSKLIFQSRQPEYPDEQIFIMNADGSGKHLVSTGLGRCTCGYFFPDMSGVVFSSTHQKDEGPQPKADMSKGYVWMVNPKFSIYRASQSGQGLEAIVNKDGYTAETTIAPNGGYMVFTGNFEGDLEIYRSNLDGSNIVRLTHEFGYDGGPFVSWDSKWIVYRRDVLKNDQERQDYADLLKENLVRPGKLEIWVMDPQGNHKRQITNLGAASFAPFMFPNDKRIIFSSNYGDPKGREFDLYTIGTNGKGLERITFAPEFDGFPMFTRDGKHLVWGSNRNGKAPHETNIFVADWVD
jgi:TolB protein